MRLIVGSHGEPRRLDEHERALVYVANVILDRLEGMIVS